MWSMPHSVIFTIRMTRSYVCTYQYVAFWSCTQTGNVYRSNFEAFGNFISLSFRWMWNRPYLSPLISGQRRPPSWKRRFVENNLVFFTAPYFSGSTRREHLYYDCINIDHEFSKFRLKLESVFFFGEITVAWSLRQIIYSSKLSASDF